MGRNRVGDAMVAHMNAHGTGYFSLCVMDGGMNDAVAELDPPLKLWKGMNPHPFNRAQVAASYLSRDDRFTVSRFHGCDGRGHARILRLYTLKAEFRT